MDEHFQRDEWDGVIQEVAWCKLAKTNTEFHAIDLYDEELREELEEAFRRIFKYGLTTE